MNGRRKVKTLEEILYRVSLAFRSISRRTSCGAFSASKDSRKHSISHIVTINLNRHVARWQKIQCELQRVKDREGTPLLEMTERLSGVDAKTGNVVAPETTLNSSYTLSDQLFVEPQPLLDPVGINGRQSIEMSPQERAIVLSHVKVWDKIAKSDHKYV